MNALSTRLPGAFLGFDHLFRNMDSAFKGDNDFPPHDIIQSSETEFAVEVALAGYSQEDIKVLLDNGILTVSGEKQREGLNFIHRGISGKSFTKRFALAENMEVKDCELENGLLAIRLVKNIPETEKAIPIEVKVPRLLGPKRKK